MLNNHRVHQFTPFQNRIWHDLTTFDLFRCSQVLRDLGFFGPRRCGICLALTRRWDPHFQPSQKQWHLGLKNACLKTKMTTTCLVCSWACHMTDHDCYWDFLAGQHVNVDVVHRQGLNYPAHMEWAAALLSWSEQELEHVPGLWIQNITFLDFKKQPDSLKFWFE